MVGYKIYNLPCQIFDQYHPRRRILLVLNNAGVVPPREKCGYDAYSIIDRLKMLQLCPLVISSIV